MKSKSVTVPTDVKVISSALLNISYPVMALPPEVCANQETSTSSGDGFGLLIASVGDTVGVGGIVAVVILESLENTELP